MSGRAGHGSSLHLAQNHGWSFGIFCSNSLGTAPTQLQSILGVLLRAIHNHIIVIIQLLLKGGSTEAIAAKLRAIP